MKNIYPTIIGIAFLMTAYAISAHWDYWQNETQIIHKQQVHRPNCGSKWLRSPGGLHPMEATICVDTFGSIETNTAHLLPEDYRRLIQPMKDSLWSVAIENALIDEDLYWEGNK